MDSVLRITKTDYIRYAQCSKSFWLYKRKSDIYPHREFSDFLKKLVNDGYEVEEYAQQLFPGGVLLPEFGDSVQKTQEALGASDSVWFQASFATEDGMFARVDILERHEDGSFTIYEVKASTKIKKHKDIAISKANHIKDICFQKIALEKLGYTVRDVKLVLVNNDYIFRGEINPKEFLTVISVQDEVKEVYEEVLSEVTQALHLLEQDEIDEVGCGCVYKTKTNHCDAFEYFNGEKPAESIYELSRINVKKIQTLLEMDIHRISDVGDVIELSANQKNQYLSAVQKSPVINREKISQSLSEFIFPLYFFDYETAMTAVPQVIGTRPWQHIPFQFSLHIMQEDGTLTHKESLSDSLQGLESVMKDIQESIGPSGTVIVWHKSFEQGRNKEMAEFFPQHATKLLDINERMFDLKDIFVSSYIDSTFGGSFSIKKVLPVVCPTFSYASLSVQDGTQAMERWFSMISPDTSPEEVAQIREDLLAYCKLDTLAMVELYSFLKRLVEGNT